MFMQTYTGRRVQPLKIAPADVVLEDLAHALALQCRFNGHVREFYSVAQHSVLVAHLLRHDHDDQTIAAWGLLHDAAEAYLGDVVTPIKHRLEVQTSAVYGIAAVGRVCSFRSAEDVVLQAVGRAFGLPWPIPGEVKHADLQLLADEAHELFDDVSGWTILDEIVTGRVPIVPWSPAEAEAAFLELAGHLGLTTAHTATEAAS